MLRVLFAPLIVVLCTTHNAEYKPIPNCFEAYSRASFATALFRRFAGGKQAPPRGNKESGIRLQQFTNPRGDKKLTATPSPDRGEQPRLIPLASLK